MVDDTDDGWDKLVPKMFSITVHYLKIGDQLANIIWFQVTDAIQKVSNSFKLLSPPITVPVLIS